MHNVDNFAVLEEPSNVEEALVGGEFDLGSCNISTSHVADIDPEKRAAREEDKIFSSLPYIRLRMR